MARYLVEGKSVSKEDYDKYVESEAKKREKSTSSVESKDVSPAKSSTKESK